VRQVCFILLWAEANGGTPAPLSRIPACTGGLAAVESGPPVAPWTRRQAHPPPGGTLSYLSPRVRGSVWGTGGSGSAQCGARFPGAAGGPWQHELVREEHSYLTHGFHREGEPSCGEAASAGYGLDASKAETRTKLPLCGVFARGWRSGLGPRHSLRGVVRGSSSLPLTAGAPLLWRIEVMQSRVPLSCETQRRVCGVQAGLTRVLPGDLSRAPL